MKRKDNECQLTSPTLLAGDQLTMINLAKPSIDDDDITAVSEVIRSGSLIQGNKVKEFEQGIIKYTGCKYAIAVSNCTSALHLALLSLNIKQSDLVLVTSYSWIATANVIELCGATPVFIDIDPETFNMNPDKLYRKLKSLMSDPTSKSHVKAILPVHTFGQIADMTAIMKIADYYNIPVIEDAACALGSILNDKKAGTWGLMSCFSFHPRKPITTGEGGIVITNNEDLTHTIQALRNHGIDPECREANFIYPGYNYRMTEFQAALGISQLKKLDRINAAKRVLALEYTKLFRNTCIQRPQSIIGSKSSYQSYVILLPYYINRENIIKQMKEYGIETTIGTIHIPLTTYYKQKYNYKTGDFPVADDISQRSLTLPLYETLTKNDQKYIVEKLLGVTEKYEKFT